LHHRDPAIRSRRLPSSHSRLERKAAMNGFNITIPLEELKPLIRQIVEETLAVTVARQLVFTEQEAAVALALEPHQLAGERKRGRTKASVTAGRRIRYHRDDIIAYLRGNRYPVKQMDSRH